MQAMGSKQYARRATSSTMSTERHSRPFDRFHGFHGDSVEYSASIELQSPPEGSEREQGQEGNPALDPPIELGCIFTMARAMTG